MAALDSLLLPVDQLNTLLQADGLVPEETTKVGLEGRTTSDDCAVTWRVAWLPMFAGSGWTAMRQQHMEDRGAKHRVWQAVVSFPLPIDANAYYTKQVAAWATCNNRHIDARYLDETPSTADTFVLNQSSQRDNVLMMTATQESLNNWSCARALTSRNNVVVDIQVCGYTLTDQAESVAKAIAAKVPVK